MNFRNWRTLKRLIVFLFIVIVMASCAAYQQLRLQSRSGIGQYVTEKVIPFEYIKGLIVVETQLNTKTTKNKFIFDTGAFNSKVEYSLSEKLALETKSKRSNNTAQGIRRTIEMTIIDSLRLNEVQFFNIAAGKLKYDKKSYSPCIAPDGIIGANAIKLANWKIDYQNKELLVSNKPLKRDQSLPSYFVDFKTSFLSGIPKIAIDIERKLIKDVLLDAGYNGGLVIPESYAGEFPDIASQTIMDQSTAGIYGSNQDTLSIKELTVGFSGFKTKIPVEFSSLDKALLGNDFLEHFNIYLDYQNKQIVFQPYEKVVIEKTKTFIPGILNDSLWIVNRSTPASPLSIGDTLITIDGLNPKDVFQSHCDYFLGISTFLNKDSLSVKLLNHQIINITSSQL